MTACPFTSSFSAKWTPHRAKTGSEPEVKSLFQDSPSQQVIGPNLEYLGLSLTTELGHSLSFFELKLRRWTLGSYECLILA